MGGVTAPARLDSAKGAALLPLALFVLLQPVFMPSLSLGGLRVVAADLVYPFALAAGLGWIALRGRWWGDPVYKWLLLWLGALLLSACFSAEPRRSFVRLASHAYLSSIVLLVVHMVRDAPSLRRLARAWIGAGGAIAALGLLTLFLFFAAPHCALLDYTLNPKGTLPPGPYPRFNQLHASGDARPVDEHRHPDAAGRRAGRMGGVLA